MKLKSYIEWWFGTSLIINIIRGNVSLKLYAFESISQCDEAHFCHSNPVNNRLLCVMHCNATHGGTLYAQRDVMHVGILACIKVTTPLDQTRLKKCS